MEKNSVRKILLIDDDPDDRKYFEEVVKEIDDAIVCEMAKDASRALTILENENASLPDYIFLDLRMPKVSGRQLLMQIKKTERWRNIPVIVYTTSKDIDESDELQSLGAIRFITKPSDTDEIFYVLSQVLEEQETNNL